MCAQDLANLKLISTQYVKHYVPDTSLRPELLKVFKS